MQQRCQQLAADSNAEEVAAADVLPFTVLPQDLDVSPEVLREPTFNWTALPLKTSTTWHHMQAEAAIWQIPPLARAWQAERPVAKQLAAQLAAALQDAGQA